jgi:multisubunit Na+/H+ antiporter MnhB subunit
MSVLSLFDRRRKRSAAERFASRPSPVTVAVGIGLLVLVAMLIALGGDRDAGHQVLIIKPSKQSAPN